MTPTISLSKNLQDAALQLLNSNLTEKRAQEIIKGLHYCLLEYSGISGLQTLTEYQQDIPLEHGHAISTNEAAQCLLDTWRTVKFLRGLHGAVKKCQSKYPGQRIGVLYAGCGPYALFLSLLAPLFEPSEIVFTLLEVNEATYRVAKQLIERLELGAYVDELLLEDAISYQIPKGKTVHVLLSETMDKALQKEAFIPILRNLKPQLPIGSIIIPEDVNIGAALYPAIEKEDGSLLLSNELNGLSGFDLGQVFNLELILDSPNAAIKKAISELQQQFGFIVWTTEVVVWQDVLLGKGESDITTAKIERLPMADNTKELIMIYHSEGTIGPKVLIN